MATHSSIHAQRISWTEERDGLQFIGLQRVGHYWSDLVHKHIKAIPLIFYVLFLNSWYRGFCWTNTKCIRSWKLSAVYCVLLPSSSSTFSLERSCHLHGTQSSSVPALSGKLLFSFYSMLCLLVLFHCFALRLCVLYAQFITPVICCPDWHQPGNITWKFIAQRNHHPFFFALWSVTGGTVFEKVSLSLPRCFLSLQLSHIANCSYQNFKMLQGIC